MPEFIYIIMCGQYFKVGRAVNPRKRYLVVRCHSPYPVELVMTMEVQHPGIAMAEERCHELLKQHHHRGEWFLCDRAVVIAAVEQAVSEANAWVAEEFSAAKVMMRYNEDRQRHGFTDALARKAELIRRHNISRPKTAAHAAFLRDRSRDSSK